MPVVHSPNFKPPVEHLFKLVEAELSPAEFKIACSQFSRLDPDSADGTFWEFVFRDEPDSELQVSIFSEPINSKTPKKITQYKPIAVRCAILPLCWWETCNAAEHDTIESYKAELAEFDRLYAQELQSARDLLGQPAYEGSDKEEPFHKQAIWRGKAGLLILQQSEEIPPRGCIINYWIQPWKKDVLAPTDPFINWLHNESQKPPSVPLPASWSLCDPGLENELNKELAFNLFHPLKGIRAVSVARSCAADDVLFQLSQHKHTFAMVHLTWKRELNPNWPETSFYDSWDHWFQSARKFSEE